MSAYCILYIEVSSHIEVSSPFLLFLVECFSECSTCRSTNASPVGAECIGCMTITDAPGPNGCEGEKLPLKTLEAFFF